MRFDKIVDLHCHILPGIDDGSKNLETSLKLAETAVADGVTHILATPHHLDNDYVNHKDDVIKVCDGTACHVRKSMPVKEALMKELGLSNKKHTTDDMLFTVETVSCLGACGLAPTLTVNDEVHPKMTPEKAIDLLNELRGETV